MKKWIAGILLVSSLVFAAGETQFPKGIILRDQTASTVPYLNSSKKLVSSSVTPTTLGYLDATSSVQTQLNGKQATGNYLTALSSDVSASGPGSSAATVNSVGGSSAANVHAAELLANAATSASTASTIVRRDSNGDFTAGTITAALSGNASTSSALASNPADCGANTFATTIAANGDLSCSAVGDSALSVSYVKADGSRGLGADWNAGAHSITATTFVGALTGSASGSAASITGSLTGDVTSTGMSTSISAATVTGKALTGFSSGSGTVSATDTILQAFNKLDGNVALKAPINGPVFTGGVTVNSTGNPNSISLNSTHVGGTYAEWLNSSNGIGFVGAVTNSIGTRPFGTPTAADFAMGAAGRLFLGANDSVTMMFDTAGKVGIGMVPVNTLDVTGTLGTTGAAAIGTTLSVGSGQPLVGTLNIQGTTGAPARFILTRTDGGTGAKNWTQYVSSSHHLIFGEADDSGSLATTYLTLNHGGGITSTPAFAVSDTTDSSSSSTGALKSSGGIAAAKTIYAGTGVNTITPLTLRAFAAAPTFIVTRAQGTEGSPSAAAAGTSIMTINAQGLDDGSTYRTGANISAIAGGLNFSSANSAAYLRFNTVSPGSTTSTERMRVFTGGSVMVGATAAWPAALTVAPRADYAVAGTTTANAATTIAGTNTLFSEELAVGDRISLSSAASTYATVTGVVSNTSITVDAALGDGTSQTINVKKSIFRADSRDSLNTGAFLIDDTGRTRHRFSMTTERFDVASTATIAGLDSTHSFVKLTGSTATTIQGVVPGVDGQRLTIVNLTGQNMTISHENGSATGATYRITTMTGADIVTTGNGAADLIYDTGSSRWICTSASL